MQHELLQSTILMADSDVIADVDVDVDVDTFVDCCLIVSVPDYRIVETAMRMMIMVAVVIVAVLFALVP
jgi:hypothetical protein